MVQTDKSKNNSKLKAGIIIGAAAAAVIIAAICIVFARSGYLANTMRLLKVEGTVNIEDSKGGSKPVIDNLRFQSGDALNTGADGLASVGLDDTKIITLDHDSRAEFKKKKKQLELKLTKGAVFFNVTEKLRADETFEIKTATMTAGIRGTSGVIFFDSLRNNIETLVLTDGSAGVTAVNPITNEVKSTIVEAGQQISVYLYSDRKVNSVEFVISKATAENLPVFAAKTIVGDNSLFTRVNNQNVWDADGLKNRANGLGDSNPPSDPPAESKPAESKPAETKPEETKPEETKPEETKPEETQPEETQKKKTSNKNNSNKKTTNTKNKSTKNKSNKNKSNKNKNPKQTTPAETKPAETKPEETKPEETKPAETKPAETKPAETKPKETKSSEPSVPSGYSKTVWGKTYNGNKVYIVDRDNEEFLGYYNGDWVVLESSFLENDTGGTETFYIADNEKVYYKRTIIYGDTTK